MATAKKPAVGGKPKLTDAEKAARKAALSKETKADKFKRLGMKRVPKALKALKAVAALASYDYTPEQAATVLDAIGAAAKNVHSRFTGEKVSEAEFKL